MLPDSKYTLGQRNHAYPPRYEGGQTGVAGQGGVSTFAPQHKAMWKADTANPSVENP